QLDDLAETAAITPGATRALAELTPPEQHRCHRLGRLDRDRAHPRGESGYVEPVFAWPGTSPAAMKDRGTERLDVGRYPPLFDTEFIEHVGAAIDLWDPQG